MVTTLQVTIEDHQTLVSVEGVSIVGKQTRVVIEGDLRATATIAERTKLGSLILKTLSKRGFTWASEGILFLDSGLGLKGSLMPMPIGTKRSLPIRLDYSHLVDEDKDPNFIRIRDWRN